MFLLFWPFRLVVWLFSGIFGLLVLLSCLLTAAAFFGDRGWLWSLTTHFRWHYLLVQTLALILASIRYFSAFRAGHASSFGRLQRWWRLMFLMVFWGLNASLIAPYYYPPSKSPAPVATAACVRLMHLNLFGKVNHDTPAVIALIRRANPDLLDFVEYSPAWAAALECSGVLARYPYRVVRGENIALYSKRPLRNARLVFAVPDHRITNQANIIAQLMLGAEPVTLLVAHPASPIAPSHWVWERQMFTVWIRQRATFGKNLVIVGDLNTAPWSAEFQKLIAGAGLRDSQLGFGLQPSWPALLPFLKFSPPSTLMSHLVSYIGIPIDHVLLSRRIAALSRHTGPFVGSDHLPVIVDLALAPSSHP